MQFGLKNRLRLISLLPIVVLFAMTSYYVYNSFLGFNAAKQLQERLDQNRHLNEVVSNIARERGMSAMYLGNKTENILKSLIEQRKVVDEKVVNYLQYAQNNKRLHTHTNDSDKSTCLACNNVDDIIAAVDKIKLVRPLVDNYNIEFEEMFMDVYGKAQKVFIKQLEQITENQIDKETNQLYSLYITMVNAKEASGVERGYMAYIISRSTELTSNDLNAWLSLIGKADAINYESIQNRALINNLDTLFKNDDNLELFEEINSERTAIISVAHNGKYNISSGIWFTMLSEKINIITQAEGLLLDAMSTRAKKVQEESLHILIITFGIWFIAIIFAILGYILSNEIAKNIKGLESVLEKVAGDYDSKERKINLHTAQGTDLAYKLLEDIIEQTKREKFSAQEANEAKSMFLANMSHEIRTPLNGIVGFTELLKDSGLKEEQREFVDIIEKSSENLLEIINNILDLSKIESHKLEIEHISFNPILEFESAVEIYAARASEKNIDLGCFIDPSLESPLKGDPTKLKEIIINLLSNAVKFTNTAGSINVNIRKLKSDEIGKTRVKFEVQDSGIGVTSEQKSKIFEAFSQADISIARKYGGTGLGLTISSNFVELMGGQLDLQSNIGEGTTFFFTLDFEEIQSLDETLQDTFCTLRALILSDSIKIKKQDNYLREYLDYYGVSYTTFSELDEAKLLLQEGDYNLLFIDYEYTDEDTLSELSKLSQELIILTKSNLMKRVDSLGLDIFKILYEPIHASKIKHVLDNYTLLNSTIQVLKKSSCNKFDLERSKFVANILVAEDNVINQKLIRRTLEDLGLHVTIAKNGLEAFQKRKDGKFDLIFMDIGMPALDGIEATAEILKWEKDHKQPHVPIIALTANALKGDREKFILAGLDEYTTKPLVRVEIISVLNTFLPELIVEAAELKKESHTPNSEYRADILIAKRSTFETKLYIKVIESMGNLTYEVASSLIDFKELINNYSYKVVIFDKEYSDLNVAQIVSSIKKLSDVNKLKSHVILVDDSIQKNVQEHIEYVDEIINNVVNGDLLKSLFTKYA